VTRSWPFRELPSQDEFLWAAGIEDTFIAEPHPATGRILDEYALTQHYERWEEDLSLLKELGVPFTRYGIPWYRVNPQPAVFDWEWTDRVLDRLVNTLRIEPIVDLVHYGTPLWLTDSFLNPEYPDRVAEYAQAFAKHYRGLCRWYTPLNEPRVNAWYAGRLGWWPPYGRGMRSYLSVLTAICKGVCLTQKAIEEVVPDALFVHVDASDLYLPSDPADAELERVARQWQDRVYLPLELSMGRVDPEHALASWLTETGFSESDFEWFRSNAVTPHVIGYNMYPMFSRKIVSRNGRGYRVRIKRCWTETLEEITRQYAAHFDLPLMITETASDGPMSRRVSWIEDSVRLVNRLRKEGVNLVGYTFWPLYSLVAWAYRNSDRDVSQYLLDMGLWDLKPGPTGLERIRTPAVDAFHREVSS
jgi:beta-glucosidase/6-phospho-beta-glucosidase/beta-galactosidase